MNLNTLVETPPWDWPEDAGQLLLKTLVDKRASEDDRLTAAELAGEIVVINDELAGALLNVVADRTESEDLRARTAISLGPVLELAYQDGFDDVGELSAEEGGQDVPITEHTFRSIQDLLHKLYVDRSNPKEVRRKILEAAGRAPDNWHAGAIREAYASGDKEWMLTAVFVMRWVGGFEREILKALNSPDTDIHFEAVKAAGGWGLEPAWPHVLKLVRNPSTPKPLLLAAIEAVGNIRPKEADEVLADLLDSDDEDIVDAANEAIMMADAMNEDVIDDLKSEEDDDADEEDDEEKEEGKGWVN